MYSSVQEKLLTLAKQLYPTGRAWKMPIGSVLETLQIALNEQKDKFYNDAVSILDSVLPDNDGFTVSDALDWEIRLGMTPNPLATLADRKAAIIRKLRYPGSNPAKEHYLYLQEQLQLAGFNLYVFENRFPIYGGGYFTQTPFAVYGGGLSPVQHGQFQHGQTQHGNFYNNKIANHIDEALDYSFDIGSNYRSTFFVGGNPIGTFGSAPLVRKNELRELILKIKPLQTVGFIFVNYT